MTRSTLSLALVATFAAACGSSPAAVVEMPDLAQPAPPDMTFDPGPYPTGPYGVKQDSVLANLTGKGYLLSPEHTDASELTYQSIAIDIIRNNPQCKCLMLSQSATWCGPCNAEQSVLVDAVTADPSFCVFNVLVEGPTPGVRATDKDVLQWNQVHGQNFPVVGAGISTYIHLPTPEALPTNVVIAPRSMKILSIEAGLGPNTIDDAKALCSDAQ